MESDELPKEQRIELAHQAWIQGNGQVAMRKIARKYGIAHSTLSDRIHGAVSKTKANETMQVLCVAEEEAIRDWLLELSQWGWPVRVDQLRGMATELLHAKGHNEDLGIHWSERFIARYPELKTKFVSNLDRERINAENPLIISAWFELFHATVSKYGIKSANIYNMDEKGCMMGVVGKVKVIVSRHEKRHYMTQPGNREWVSLIESISMTGQRTRPWIIFKGKQQQKAWFQAYPEARIGLSTNGWTDNELGFEWLHQCFEPETRLNDSNEWRLLIVDGHASHVTTQAIKFCIANRIILLCLPPHSTHLLQPLDVGIFAALATVYKKGVLDRSRYYTTYSIDKLEFLDIYKVARDQAITESNIIKAWASVGLKPFEPKLVLDKLLGYPDLGIKNNENIVDSIDSSIQPGTPTQIAYTNPRGETIHMPITPSNTAQVQKLFGFILQGESSLNPALRLNLEKLQKGAIKAITNAEIQRTTNQELLLALNHKTQRAKKAKVEIMDLLGLWI